MPMGLSTLLVLSPLGSLGTQEEGLVVERERQERERHSISRDFDPRLNTTTEAPITGMWVQFGEERKAVPADSTQWL